MERVNFIKAGALALTLVLVFFISWELYWRDKGFSISYNDDEALWAWKRSKVYMPQDYSTVIIGSSRVKFDIDLDTWQEITGEEPVQLALVGSSPRLLLHELANDENFQGKLLVGVTERAFFMPPGTFADMRPQTSIDYYKKLTLSQQASFEINKLLESQLVFLDKGHFSLSAFLDELSLSSRPGIFSFPFFPREFELTKLNRQTYMPEIFLRDSVKVNRQREIWTSLGMLDTSRGISDDTLQALLDEVKTSVDKIKARGGKVVFVRPPSSGPMREAERKAYPRHLYWDKLLAYTNTFGIHYEDYPQTDSFDCPEWSHLTPADAVIYTEHLIKTLKKNKRGNFKWKISTIKVSSHQEPHHFQPPVNHMITSYESAH